MQHGKFYYEKYKNSVKLCILLFLLTNFAVFWIEPSIIELLKLFISLTFLVIYIMRTS